jgi:hypothetical protein
LTRITRGRRVGRDSTFYAVDGFVERKYAGNQLAECMEGTTVE